MKPRNLLFASQVPRDRRSGYADSFYRNFFTVIGVCVIAFLATPQQSYSATSQTKVFVEVPVLVDEPAFIAGLNDVESIVDASKADTPAGFAVRSRFGGPDKTRLLIEKVLDACRKTYVCS